MPQADLRGDTERLSRELAELRATADASVAQREAALREAEERARQVQSAEEAARKALEERELWELLAAEEAAKREQDREALMRAQAQIADLERLLDAELEAVRTSAAEAPAPESARVLEQTNTTAAEIQLDEAATRLLIDEQLRAQDWEVNSQELRYANGARPQKGKNLAITEWPTEHGPADYVLFCGMKAVAVVEAKKATFATWREGATLDIAGWLDPDRAGGDRRTPGVIVSVAHLDDDERALVLGVLLEEVLTWVRSLPGSKRLRALIVFDEVYGFLPPHLASPPTKRPIVALMKQGRAFGVGRHRDAKPDGPRLPRSQTRGSGASDGSRPTPIARASSKGFRETAAAAQRETARARRS